MRDGSGEILRGNAPAIPRPVFQNKGIVALLADLRGMRKALVDGTDIGEAAAWSSNGGSRALAGGVCLLGYRVGSDLDLLRVSMGSDLDVELVNGTFDF